MVFCFWKNDKMSFKFIVISPSELLPDEQTVLTDLFSNGLNLFHLRKPAFSKKKMEQYIQQIPEKFYSKIVIHSHYELTLKYNLKGIHLTENTRKNKLNTLLKNKSISASFHNLQDLQSHRRMYDYVFLSPIFNSLSKKNYKSNFDLNDVEYILNSFRKRKKYIPQVIALGGIEIDNINLVKQAGFSGAAVLGAIWESKNPFQAFLDLKSEIY